MSRYIDAEKLIAELRRQKHELELSIQSQGDYGQSCQIVAYENIISLIASLQQEQPQVADASKMEQPNKTLDLLMGEVKRYYSENYAYITSDQPTLSILTNVARHFFELGKTARKEK